MKSTPIRYLFTLLCIPILSFGGQYFETEALFVRTTGAPQEETVSFTVYNPTVPHSIKIQNGPPGYERISSASVSLLLNDQQIFGSSDFNQQVEWLEKPIAVTASSTLRVLLTSKPGGALKIWVYGTDDYPPSISITVPVDQAILTTTQPSITCAFSDIESGCVPDSFRILLNGTDYTPLFTVTTTSATAVATNLPHFSEGIYTISASIADRGGNRSTVSRQCAIDISAPQLSISAPENGSAINDPQPLVVVRFSDAVSGIEPGSLAISLDGTDVLSRFSIDATQAIWAVGSADALSEGSHRLVVSIADKGDNGAVDTALVTVDLTQPIINGVLPSNGTTATIPRPTISASFQDGLSGVDPATMELFINHSQVNGPVEVTGEGFSYTPQQDLAAGTYVVTIRVKDFAGNHAQATTSFNVVLQMLPPDPSTIAPPLDQTQVADFRNSVEFLYTGSNPIQEGVAPGTIEARRAAVVRGKVLARGNEPLPGAKISIYNHPEFGHTFSRLDGMFDLVVNGGGAMVLKYEKENFFDVQRRIEPEWRNFMSAPDVVMLQKDANVTPISLAVNDEIQVARGSITSDERGERQATILFPSGIQASGLNGSINVRATEYTIGEDGEKAMPAQLPPGVGYTYCVELSVDGVDEVRFNQPVYLYLENFLNFPVGGVVPAGYYDKNRAAWIPSDNGKIVKVLAIENNVAMLDIDGSGQAADAQSLTDLGISDEERERVATLYTPGQSLWRVPIPHFSPWDCNWPVGLPPGARPPGQPAAESDEDLENPCTETGSIIEVQNQIVKEKVDISGTPFSLCYSSGRVAGRKTNYSIKVPLTGADLPPSLERVGLMISVAGNQYRYSYPPEPGVIHLFQWDGFDCFSRKSQGRQLVDITIGYAYANMQYQEPVDSVRSFGELSGIPVPGSAPVRRWETLLQKQQVNIGTFNPASLGLGGWTLDIHHAYDPVCRVLELGDGRKQNAETMSNIITVFAGYGVCTAGYTGEGGPALQASIDADNVAVASDGTVYVVVYHSRICKISTAGTITTVAGADEFGYRGDNGPATQALFNYIGAIDVDADNNIYIADAGNNRIRRIASNGNISTIAGTGVRGFGGDGGPAIEACLDEPLFGLKAGPDGSVYFWDHGNARLRRIGVDGIITTISGTGVFDSYGNNCPARQAGIGTVSDMTIASDGSIFLCDPLARSIRKIGTDGVITTFAGSGNSGTPDGGVGGQAIDAEFWQPWGICIDNQGNFYCSDRAHRYIRKIDPEGIFTTFAGIGTWNPGFTGEDGPPTSLNFNVQGDITIGPDKALYIADHGRVFRIKPTLPGFTTDDIVIPSEDASQIYRFNSNGKHLATLDALTGKAIYSFVYNEAGLLSSVVDRDSNVTVIERDADNTLTAIVSPYGQRTSFILNRDSMLIEAMNPVGKKVSCTYHDSGLMATFTDYNNNITHFTYDSLGYLIREDNAAGGFLRLEREKTERGFRVTKYRSVDENTSYETSYLTEKLSTGETRQVTSGCCGGPIEMITGTDGGKKIISPDGTITTFGYGPDPRFNMQAPIVKETRITTPSGLTYEMRGNRTALPVDRENPVYVDSLIDSITVNGLTYVTITDAVSGTISAYSPSGRVTAVAFDTLGRVVRNEVNGILPLNYVYDERGRLTGIRQGEGWGARGSGISYNPQGYVATILNALQQSDGYTYDLAGRITNVILANGLQTGYTYDGNGNITALTPPGKPMHEFEYTPVNLVNTYAPPAVEPGENATRYTYNLNKQITRIARPDGLNLQFNYNSLGRIINVQLPGGNAVSYSYNDSTNNLIGIASGDAELTWQYDGSLPMVLGLTGAITGNLALAYNNDYRVSSLSVNGNDAVYYGYDADGAVTQAGAMSYSYHPNGRLNTTFIGNIDDAHAYNEFGDRASYAARYAGSDIFNIEYTGIDKLGRITGKTETFDGTTRNWQYSYDAVGQLTDVYLDGVPKSHYEYDGVGNRIGYSGSGGAITATYDDQDRMVTYGGRSYTYTANGELSSKTDGSGTTLYSYDVLGNLKTVTLPSGTVIEYVIDGMNRRIGKKVNGALVSGFVYKDQLCPVAQLDNAGNVVSTFVYGTRINVPDYMVRDGVAYKIITDHLGSPRLVIDVESGQIAQRMDFDEFGVVTLNTNPGFQPFGFAGGLYDVQTGLVRFGARDYDAETGRWTCKDPIGFEGEDENLYRYCWNDPINYIDPVGLDGKADKPVVKNPPTNPAAVGGKMFPQGFAPDVADQALDAQLDVLKKQRYRDSVCDIKPDSPKVGWTDEEISSIKKTINLINDPIKFIKNIFLPPDSDTTSK